MTLSGLAGVRVSAGCALDPGEVAAGVEEDREVAPRRPDADGDDVLVAVEGKAEARRG